MDRINEKLNKQENSLTRLLRKLLNQKDEQIKKQSIENAELKLLLLKQQELLNKLNDENMRLTNNLQAIKPQEDNTLSEQNKSLKQQLLVSQQHNSIMASELNEARLQIKVLTKKLMKHESTTY